MVIDNQYQRNMDAMDVLNVISLIAQFDNMDGDKKYKNYIQEFAAKIQKEVDQLHAENDLIMDKLDDILEKIYDK